MPPVSAIAPGPGLPDPDFVGDVRTCWCMGGLRRCWAARVASRAPVPRRSYDSTASSDSARGRHPPRAGPPASPLRHLAKPVSAGSDGLTPVSRFHTRPTIDWSRGARRPRLGGDPREAALVGGCGARRRSSTERSHTWRLGAWLSWPPGSCPGLLPGSGDHATDRGTRRHRVGALSPLGADTSKFSPLR